MIKGYIWMCDELPQTCVDGVFYYWNPTASTWCERWSQDRAKRQFERKWKDGDYRPAHIKFKRRESIFSELSELTRFWGAS